MSSTPVTRWVRDGMWKGEFSEDRGSSCANLCHSRHVEKYLAAEAPHKHLVFVLNKIDLVPSSTAVSLIRIESTLYSNTRPFPLIRLPSGPRALVRILPHCHLSCSMGDFRYDPGRVISTSNVPDLVFRLGIGRRRFGVLPPDTGRVSYELKAATVRLGQHMAVFLVMIHTSQLSHIISCHLGSNGC